MYYLVFFTNGAMGIFTGKPTPSHFQKGATFFEVDGNLTVADISEILSGSGFERNEYPQRLASKITKIQ